jgi:hypothetical protein
LPYTTTVWLVVTIQDVSGECLATSIYFWKRLCPRLN